MAADVLIPVDFNKPAMQQSVPMHNRWHQDILAVKTVKPGPVFRAECLDWTGDQIKNNDSANDIRDIDLTQVNFLSGPIGIEGAQPENLLVVDILTRGFKVYFPVYVPGANLSTGDIHFSQGDGKIAFCGGIEMAGWLKIKVSIVKGGMETYKVVNPIFEAGSLEPNYSNNLTFEGILVDEQGTQHYLDAHISYRRACLNAIEYLKQFGYTCEQAYILLSIAPVKGRMSGIVDIPNVCCTVSVLIDIFDCNIKPSDKKPQKTNRGQIALTT